MRLLDVVDEAQVAVGEDADQPAAVVRDRHAGDVVALHDPQGVAHRRSGGSVTGSTIMPDSRALDLVDLGHLVLDRQVAVDDAEPSCAGQGDRQAGLGDGVHGGGDDRDV